MATNGLAMSRRLGHLARVPRISSVRPVGVSMAAARPWVCRSCSKGAAVAAAVEGVRMRSTQAGKYFQEKEFAPLDTFPRRHIGPDDTDAAQMLRALDPPVESIDAFVAQVIPPDVLSDRPLFPEKRSSYVDPTYKGLQDAVPESQVLALGKHLAEDVNTQGRSLIGAGYYGTITPEVIKRNVLENPAWYTSYTPYQPEISQGRLESLLNFQTLVCDLTALPISNASLLDEGTAAAEAMTLSMNTLSTSRLRRPGKTFVVSHLLHHQTISVLYNRAEGFGITIEKMDIQSEQFKSRLEELGDDLVGVMVQYPDTKGGVEDFREVADLTHSKGALLSCATDLLALTLLTPPGEWGADIAFGNAQRLGVPMGFGGPHAAFFAVTEKHKRKIPGRLVGVSKDRRGGRALRLALQTREQHIRREKATSNVCTAQALLANMTALYAIYHGPAGLKEIAEKIVRGARIIQDGAEHFGFKTRRSSAPDGRVLFDTVVIECPRSAVPLLSAGRGFGYNFRYVSKNEVGISIDETVEAHDLGAILHVFALARQDYDKTEKRKGAGDQAAEAPEGQGEEDGRDMSASFNAIKDLVSKLASEHARGTLKLPDQFERTSQYLTHPVFNTHHSETEMLRYIYHLQSKDISLVHSMIPLGSCTMKLNGSTEMALITQPGFANAHPFALVDQSQGYQRLINALGHQLKQITDMQGVTMQPNSGAQGEFAGLRTIRKYHQSLGQMDRDICLIPVSAHGTNPASAAMAGMRVVPIKCDMKTGNLDIADLEAKCQQYSAQIGAMMITYPSTFGVFEPQVKKVCEVVHAHGGQVYMDGANMNAQIGLCSPGEIGADVCHLNLHKTFCIPHGGGGPGVGPICVKEHLKPFLPSLRTASFEPTDGSTFGAPVSSAPYGSASILPISWAYNTLMGAEGLKRATQLTLLNANYLLSRLRPHYQILYTNEHGRCAHEFILDARPFRESAGIEAIDIAKRLQDYGFHAPTMSWPVANTLMIEPTESESKEELDRFVDALVAIREEIREVEEGQAPREGNVLKMAPHPMSDIVLGEGEGGAEWARPYSREKAAYPLPWLREKKFWPTVARVDDSFGDLNLFCTCPPVEDTTGDNLSSTQEE